jgi:aspartyl-tRNA synthetase
MGIAAGFDRVFEIGPAFRAEPSFTSRHETEFTSVDMEFSWIDSHHDVMRMEEQWLVYALTAVKEKHGEKIKEHYGVDIVIPETPFPAIPLGEAREILKSRGHEITHKLDLDPEGERQICAYVREKFGHEFVWIIDYPHEVRAFYHMRHADNPELTKSFDLLWKGVEVTTGAQREHRYDQLVKQAIERGYDLGPIQDYLNFFKYGCPPHGGAGIGLARLLMMMLERESIRETTLLSRTPTRLTP